MCSSAPSLLQLPVSITVETLKEIGKLDTKVGNTILAAALIDDVLGLIALTIVSSLSGGQDSIALVLLKIVLFFVFSTVVSFLAHKFFCWLMACGPAGSGAAIRCWPLCCAF